MQSTEATWMQNSCGIKNNFCATVKTGHLTLLVREHFACDFQQFHWLLSFLQTVNIAWLFHLYDIFSSGFNQVLVQVAKILDWIWN